MGLQGYIVNFIGFVSNLVIPFLLGMAFVIFVINVIRYFVIGGSNEDSQTKAKSLAVYGVGAFALIMIFWGIVNVLSSSLGLSGLAATTPQCVDYACGATAAQQTGGGGNVGDNFGDSLPIDPGGGSGTPVVNPNPDVSNPFGNPLSPQLQAPVLDLAFDSVSSISTDSEFAYQTALQPVAQTITNYIPNVTNDLLELEFAQLPDESFSPTERIQMLKSYNMAGIVVDGSFFATADNINDVYEANGESRVSLITPELTVYTDRIMRYSNAVRADIAQSNTYAQSVGLQNESQLAITANDLYSNNNSLSQNIDNAYAKYQLLTGTQQGISQREGFITNFLTATNVYIERTGDNDGTPITRDDILGN
jgi:hypothetical protein